MFLGAKGTSTYWFAAFSCTNGPCSNSFSSAYSLYFIIFFFFLIYLNLSDSAWYPIILLLAELNIVFSLLLSVFISVSDRCQFVPNDLQMMSSAHLTPHSSFIIQHIAGSSTYRPFLLHKSILATGSVSIKFVGLNSEERSPPPRPNCPLYPHYTVLIHPR